MKFSFFLKKTDLHSKNKFTALMNQHLELTESQMLLATTDDSKKQWKTKSTFSYKGKTQNTEINIHRSLKIAIKLEVTHAEKHTNIDDNTFVSKLLIDPETHHIINAYLDNMLEQLSNMLNNSINPLSLEVLYNFNQEITQYLKNTLSARMDAEYIKRDCKPQNYSIHKKSIFAIATILNNTVNDNNSTMSFER